jgi:hypothetical protein
MTAAAASRNTAAAKSVLTKRVLSSSLLRKGCVSRRFFFHFQAQNDRPMCIKIIKYISNSTKWTALIE